MQRVSRNNVHDNALAIPWSHLTERRGDRSDKLCGDVRGHRGLSKVQISYTFTTLLPNRIAPLNGLSLTATACFPNST